MIERQTFDGRDASVMYFDANFKPVQKGHEDYVRIFFDDGETIVLTPPTKEAKSKQKFNPHHEPAGGPTGGQFSAGDGGGGDGGDKGGHVVAGVGDETSKDFKFPEKAGTVPIPDGHVRLYHQTSADNLAKIGKEGIKFEHARGIEGPKGIYADEQGFYGEPGRTPTAEFHVSKDRWDKPFVTGEDVKPEEIIALHYPWHSHARYIESHPKTLEQVLNGEHDDLLEDREHGPAIRYIQAKYAEPKKAFEKFNPHHEPAGSSEGGRFAAGDGEGGGASTDTLPHAGKGGEPQTAYHGVKTTDGEFKLPDPEVEKVVARAIGIHVAKDPELGKTFTDIPGRPQQAFGEGPSDLHVLDIPHDNKLYDVEQDKSKEADENKIGNLVYKTAFKQDPALFARYLGRQWELPKDRATKLADDILHDRPATITGFGPVNGLDDYFAKQGVVTIWHNKDRAQAVQLFWDEFKGKGWQGLKYTSTPIIPSDKVKDHTAYVVFDPADIKFKDGEKLFVPFGQKSNPYHEPAGSPEGGQFTSGGGSGGGGDAKPSASAGPKVQSGLGVSSLNTTRVRAGIRVIPKAHAERIKDVPIYVVKDSKEIPGNKNPTNEGLFTAAKDGKDAAIFIPTTMQAHGLKGKREYPLTAISRSTVHEMGHALDHHSGWKHTDLINKEVVHGMVQMTAKERKDAGYFLTSPHEAFAELYSLAYDAHVDQDVPRYFGSLTRERAETVFADALAKVKAIP